MGGRGEGKWSAVRKALAFLLAFAAAMFVASRAAAVPAFAVQTGEPCQMCHVGGFGPQLTALGRQFKLQGYTLRTNKFNIPFSAMAVASYINTAKAQEPPPAPHYSGNDNLTLDQFSIFFAGGFGQHFGAFVQTTYDGVARAWHWDNLDLRATTTLKIKGVDTLLGLSVNNSPTVQDPWNTLPAWGFPYTTSSLAPGPSASPLLNGSLAQTTLGVTGYAWINSAFYVEAGGYGSPGATSLRRLGVDPTSPGAIRGTAPYGRFAYQRDIGPGTLELGVFGMRTEIYPGLDRSTGFTDRYTDLGVDGSYIATLGSGDVVTVNTRYLHERQRLDATCALAEADVGCAGVNLNDARVDASYYWRNKIGGTIAVFNTSGSANPIAYAANRTFKPDSTGVTFQIDGTPFGGTDTPLGRRFNIRIGAQYTAYTEFNGATHDYDGLGHNAGDNNTFRVFAWVAY